MSFDEFANYTKDNIEEYLNDLDIMEVVLEKIQKNNNIMLTGLTVCQKGRCSFPIIYLEQFYESYLENEPIDAIVREIAGIYLQNMPEDDEFDENSIESSDCKIIMRLVNYDRNEALLKTCPHQRLLDLAITYRMLFKQNKMGIASALITNHMFEKLGITQEKLHSEAVENCRDIFPGVVETIPDALTAVGYREIEGDLKESDDSSGILDEMFAVTQMHIVSNPQKINGASVLLYSDCLKELADRLDSDLLILPSSIHEVLALPYRGWEKSMDMKEVVRDANRIAVLQEEILSYNVYRYDRNKEELLIVA